MRKQMMMLLATVLLLSTAAVSVAATRSTAVRRVPVSPNVQFELVLEQR